MTSNPHQTTHVFGDDSNTTCLEKKIDPSQLSSKIANKPNVAATSFDLPNWSGEEVQYRLQESARLLQEWNDLMNKTGMLLLFLQRA